jgi:hypothetical protein
MVVACIALVFAMTGAGYAAGMLGPNTVGTKQLKKNAVISSKVKNGSLLKADFKAGQLPAGPQGPAGPAGPAGAAGAAGPAGPPGANGSARAYAIITRPAGIDPTYRRGTGWAVAHPSVGVYCVTPPAGINPATDNAVVTVEWANSLGFDLLAYWNKLVPFAPCVAGQYQVRTYNFPGGAAALSDNISFQILIP